jgi:hypothetical protein
MAAPQIIPVDIKLGVIGEGKKREYKQTIGPADTVSSGSRPIFAEVMVYLGEEDEIRTYEWQGPVTSVKLIEPNPDLRRRAQGFFVGALLAEHGIDIDDMKQIIYSALQSLKVLHQETDLYATLCDVYTDLGGQE